MVSGSQDADQRPIPVSRSIQVFNRTARRCRSNRFETITIGFQAAGLGAHGASELLRRRRLGEQHQPGSISRQPVADARRSWRNVRARTST